MRQTRNVVIVLVSMFLTAVAGSYASEPVDLLEGKSVDDFDYFLNDNAEKAAIFSLNADNVLAVKGNPFGWLGTKEEYKNFILNVEFRYPDRNNSVNSGIFLRVQDSGMFLPKCVEVQLAPNSMGDLYGFWDMKIGGTSDRCNVQENNDLVKTLRSVKNFQNAKLDDLTQWHSAEILCCDDLIVVRINGQLANWTSGVEVVSGKIAFQSEGAPIEFRNAKVAVLE